MGYKYEINGQTIEFDKEPTEQDIDEVASNLKKQAFGRFLSTQIMPTISKGFTPQLDIQSEIGKNLLINPITKTASDVMSIPSKLTTMAQEKLQQIPQVKKAYESPGTFGGFAATSGNIPLIAKTLIEGMPSAEQRRKLLTEDISNTIGTGALMGVGKLAGKFLPAISENISQNQKFNKFISEVKKSPDKILRGGLTKDEALRIEQKYGKDTSILADNIKNAIQTKREEADLAYEMALNNLPDNQQIKASNLYETLRKNLKDRGWIQFNGVPTTRYKSGLGVIDRLNDQLTNIFLDIKNSGKLISKSDFSRFRDNLKALGWKNPIVQESRVALYNDAEKAGMEGIKTARDLDSQIFKKEDLFLNEKGDLKLISQKQLDKLGVGKGATKEQLQHIKELESYINQSIISEAEKINKLQKARSKLSKFGWISGIGTAEELTTGVGRRAIGKFGRFR